ncbi:MAG: SufD family Fe-S cluster assembly protein [Candidatus Lustribacter sp.]|jgi:Fe-S cluster assembly protein SufD
MPGTISEPLDFAPTGAMLAAAIDELRELGTRGGGAVEGSVRERALRAFLHAQRERTVLPPGWRHDYAKLDFGGLTWSSGRARVPVLPRASAAHNDSADVPALAVDNAGGIVHAGSTYLEPLETAADPRVRLSALADAAGPAAAAHLRIVAPETDRFTALAAAFQNCGAYVEVPAGVVPAAPLQLVWMSRPGSPAAVFPHTVIRLGAGARATVVERHIGNAEAFIAGIVEAELGPDARLDYVAVQQTDEGTRFFMHRRARCAAGASIAWHVADLGGALVRTVCSAQLAAARASAETNAFFFAHGFAHVDAVVDADHDASRTESHATIRCAATDRARGRFAGALRFAPNATRCVATMRDDGLILSRDAYLDAAPTLAVPAHRVSASHATNIGSLDEEELFYVQSRGISRGLAERMMAMAFFEPAISRFPTDAVRDEVRTALDARLNDVPDTFE